MDRVALRGRVMEFLNKYKFVALVLLLGLVLMAIPSRTSEETDAAEVTTPTASEPSISDELAEILCKIDGAGKVQVMLTVAAGEETIYQVNEDISQEAGTTRSDTVTVTNSSRDQTGLIRQVNPPRYQGAIIVCQGADSPAVRLAIVEAVASVTGLGADRITVLKMK